MIKRIIYTCCLILIAQFAISQDTTCIVTLQEIQGGFCLQAVAEGNGPFEYLWEDNSTLDYICPNSFGTHCVTATSTTTGCVAFACGTLFDEPLDSCSVYINSSQNPIGTTLTANFSGTPPFTYIWNTGELTPDIISTPGSYCVTATDVLGCEASNCFEVIDSTFNCNIWIVTEPINSGIGLIANTDVITDDYEFYWNTGVQGSMLAVQENGTYCVTITSTSCPNGENVACETVSINNIDSCSVSIDLVSNNLDSTLTATAIGIAPYTYQWSTGELTESILPFGEGLYCVTITDSAGCQANDCYNINDPIVNCNVWINVDSLASGLSLTADTDVTTDDYFFYWDNGQQGSTITVLEEGTYCVTVTSASCPNGENSTCTTIVFNNNNNCAVEIGLEVTNSDSLLTATVTGTSPFSYQWSTGENTSTITPYNFGLYCVTITDALNCYSTDCFTYFSSCYFELLPIQNGQCLQAVAQPNQNLTYSWSDGSQGDVLCNVPTGYYCVTSFDFNTNCTYTRCDSILDPLTNCYAYIEFNNIDFTFDANAYGQAPFSYQWSGGETTAQIPAAIGDFCVTITDANGCESDECISYENIVQDSCTIYSNNTNAGILLYVNNNAAISYEWSNGETTATIYGEEEMTYCVTVTNFDNSVCESCYTVPDFPSIISGNIMLPNAVPSDTSSFPNIGFVILYELTATGEVIVVDSTNIWGNSIGLFEYDFNYLNNGDYFVQAIIYDNIFSDNYAPTYYGDVLFWDMATAITVSPSFYGADITMIPQGEPPSGPGNIDGTVTDGSNFSNPEDRGGNPVAGVYVFLLDENGEVLDYDITNDSGQYSFFYLGSGDYSICVDQPGVEHLCVDVTLNENVLNQTINFDVNEEGIMTGIEHLEHQQLSLFPNPAADQLNLTIDASIGAFELKIHSSTGQLIEKRQISNSIDLIEINLENYPDGIYFLSVQNKEINISKNFIKM